MSKKIIGIYPGTFDPITIGHADIIKRAGKITDKLIIAVSESETKKPLFSLKERCEMARIYSEKYGIGANIEIMSFKGLLVDFAKSVSAKLLIRGLRAVSDFEYEFQMACMNSRLDDSIETIFLPSSEKNQFVSSRFVKEIARMDGDISSFLIPEIEKKLLTKYGKN